MQGATKRISRAAVGLAALLLLASAGSAVQAGSSVRLGGGVFGVYGTPLLQEDAGSGPLYGAKGRIDLIGPLGAELSYLSYQEGDLTFPVNGQDQTIAGGTQNAITLNAVLGGPSIPGFGIYLTGGVGTYTLTKDHRPDETPLGYNVGLGLELRTISGIALDVSGRVHAVMPEDGGSRKFAALQAGVNFYFLR